MKTFFKITGILIILVTLLISCDSNKSLQQYYVDSKENNEFISLDLPSSILQLKNTEVSKEVKETLETIKKVNFLALQLTDDNKDLYAAEKLKVMAILKNPKYKQLMRFNGGKGNVSVNYLGDEDAIDEVVIFGSDNKKGFAIVRVIGNNMNPSNIMKISQNIQLDGDSNQLKQLKGLMQNIN